MKKKEKIIILGIVIEFVITMIISISGYSHGELQVLSTKRTEIDKGNFGIYYKTNIEDEYQEYKEDGFPKGYYLNGHQSECVDSQKQPVLDVKLISDGTSVTVTSNKTVYCKLYFEKIWASMLTYDNVVTKCKDTQCSIDELYQILKGK